jgi:hypothetical protein
MMKALSRSFSRTSFVLGLLGLVAGCGGSGGSGGEKTGFIAIGITDAPIDEVSAVVVEFTGVTLKPSSGDEITITFDTAKSFDLLTLTGGLTAELLRETEVPVGEYNWVRLAVNAEFDSVFDSYAMTPTGQVELRVPSGNNSGLKLVSGFTVTQDQSTNLVIDWDLRKALSDPLGQTGIHLRPALRVTDMSAYGTLTGTVSDLLVNDESCTNDPAMGTGSAVYLYNGVVEVPGDIGDAVSETFTTATASQDESGTYVFEINFLSVGEYTAAFTCQASDDDPAIDDDIVFSAPQTLMIDDGMTKSITFE